MKLEEIKECLHRSGYRVTPQRMAIIRVMLASPEHLTPAALYKKVSQIDPEVGEVTVYRTLNMLESLGLVCLVHTGENTHGYISRPAEHHGHLICSECGKVINFTGCNVSSLEKRLAKETGFVIQNHRLDFYGRCRDCAASSRSDSEKEITLN